MTPQCVHVLAICCVVTLGRAESGVSTTTVALTNQQSFGSVNEQFLHFRPPTINNNGIVGFGGTTRIGSTLFEGLFLWQAGVGQQLAKEGDPFPGNPFFHYTDAIGTPVINDAGTIAFGAGLNGWQSLIAGTPGNFQIIGLANNISPNPDPDPNYPDGFQRLEAPLLAPSGMTGFAASNQNITQIWGGIPGAMAQHFQAPAQAPGYPEGVVVTNLGGSRINNAGQIISQGVLSGGTYSGARVLLLSSPSSSSIIAGPGQPAPGLPGTLLGSGTRPHTNGGGIIGLSSAYREEVTQNIYNAAWVGPPGGLEPIAVQGEQAPGFAQGHTFNAFIYAPLVTRSGHAALLANVDGPGSGDPQIGLWHWDRSDLSLITKVGDPVANISGATWTGWGGASNDDHMLAVNDRNQIAFLGDMNVPGQGTTFGLLATDLDGDLVAVAVAGRPFEVAPGITRIVHEIDLYGQFQLGTNGDDGYGSFLNDAGQIGFRLEFTDGSFGVFVSTVPAPSGLALLGVVFLHTRRWRRSS